MGWIEREVDQFEAPLQMLMVVVVLSFRTRESKIVSLSPVSFFEHKL